jgi:photoactive yellow protein
MSVSRLEMEGEALLAEIGAMTPQQLDELPFGAIHLDATGTVLAYNKTEERLAARKAAEVVGRNFFAEVAPCTRVRRFFGAFQAGVDRKQLNEVFDFTFRFPAGTREVRIRMIYSAMPRPGVWVFVTPLG